MESPLGGPRVDALMLADHAQAIDGKLYVMGGGFNTVLVGDFRLPVRFAFAAILHVPWEYTARTIPVEGFLEDFDGARLEGFRLEGDVQTHRSEQTAAGTPTVIALAGPVELTLPGPADLLFVLRFGEDRRSQRFSVRPAGERR